MTKIYGIIKTSNGFKTLKIIDINRHSVAARIVSFGKRSMISGITRIAGYGEIKRFKIKRVTIYSKGITPIF